MNPVCHFCRGERSYNGEASAFFVGDGCVSRSTSQPRGCCQSLESWCRPMAESNLFLNLFRHREGELYPAGRTVIEAGTKGVTMYVVFDGEVEIRAGNNELEIGGPGTIFGEMALIDDAPRSATVIARTDCRLVEIDRRRFEFMVQETPFFALAVMKIMADRLRRVNTKVASTPGRTPSEGTPSRGSNQ